MVAQYRTKPSGEAAMHDGIWAMGRDIKASINKHEGNTSSLDAQQK